MSWLIAFLLAAIGGPGALAGSALALNHSQSSFRVPRYDILEITFRMPPAVAIANPLTDVDITVQLAGPDGATRTVGGFFYDQGGWKARFAPDTVGPWRYHYSARVNTASASGDGAFECIPSSKPGFLRINPKNPFTWVFDDGAPFWPMGIQDCVGDYNKNGTVLDTWSLDGGDRSGPWVASPCDVDTYLGTYAQAGFNLFRFSQANCSYNLYDDLDHYLLEPAMWTDQLLEKLQDHGYRIFYGFFGYANAFAEDPKNAEAMAKVKRFLKYSVDRWGAYVDIWELLNEQTAADGWTTMMAEYVRSIDPYQHPVATSWEHPELKPIDINAPHWYELENWWDSDTVTAQNAKEWKKFGKPVVVGEQGNRAGAVWDYTSAMRMRIRSWTALFSGISFVFWNTSYAPNGHHMNIYLGPEERQYIRALQSFASLLDPAMRPVDVTTSDQEQVRAYALASADRAAVYLRNSRGGDLPEKASITLDVPHAGTGYWIDPRDGSMTTSLPVSAGRQTILLPKFERDCALFIADGPLALPPAPVIKANPQYGLAPQAVVLDGRKSAGAFGREITSYHWEFGDGTTAEGPVAAHTYPYGNYLAALTVTDTAGARATAGLIIRIASSLIAKPDDYKNLPDLAPELARIEDVTKANRAPVAAASADPASGPSPLAVRFRGSGTDVDGIVVSCRWDFGDGESAATLDAQHLYQKPGTYIATLTVTDDRGATGSASVTVRVSGG